MLNGCKEGYFSSRSLGLRISPPDEEKKGDVHSEEILTSISQRKSLFDLDIIGLGERNWDQGAAGTRVSLHSDLGAQQGLEPRCARSCVGSSFSEQVFRTNLVLDQGRVTTPTWFNCRLSS